MANTLGSRVGGLAEALRGRSSPWSTEPKSIRPRPARDRAWIEPQEEPEVGRPLSSSCTGPCASSGGVSMLGDADPAVVEAGLAELRRLFATECSLGTSVPGFGVSPPVRSGAANGLVHDSLWRQEAPRACKASLRALHERGGRGCLSACAGDYRLLMTSPDSQLPLLRSAVEGDDSELEPSTALSRSMASSRASPAATLGWHPAQSVSPDPSDLFSC